MTEPSTPQEPIIPAQRIEVSQEKSASFRVVHADGAWCSVNPYRNLHVTFYSERAPIPKKIFLKYEDPDGWKELVDEREVKKGWFREMEVDVVLDLNGARALYRSMTGFIALLEQQEKLYEDQKAAATAGEQSK
jgi:hypothetical protein